tara:strand:- start:235 stop:477 length:243 start_codon:yes stop_codon:yes gene_type:complete
MEMPSAKEHAKSKIEVSREFYHRVCDKIIKSKSGRITHYCSGVTCSPQEKDLAIRLLREKGYKITFGFNSHGTEYIIVEW